MDALIDVWKQLQTALEKYNDVDVDEPFVDDPTKDEKDLIDAAETQLDCLLDKKKKENDVLTLTMAFEAELQKLRQYTIQLQDDIIEKDGPLVKQTNELVDTIQVIRTRQAKKKEAKEPKSRGRVMGECNDENKDTESKKVEEHPVGKMKQRIEDNLSVDVIRWQCEMDTNSVLFDTDTNKWSMNDSEFVTKLQHHRHICIVIEDTEGNVFGGFQSQDVGTLRHHFDATSFVFSLKRNGNLTIEKYRLKAMHYDLRVCGDADEVLFAFGAEDVDGVCQFRDICVYKKGVEKKSYCKQHSYEYGSQTDALCGHEEFDVKRIVVYEMKETDVMKALREGKEAKELDAATNRWADDKRDVKKLIKQLTGKKVKKTIFRSETNRWNRSNSEFSAIINGKSNVVVVVEDERQNLFGGFMSAPVNVGTATKDDNCFVFSLMRDGVFEARRFDWKKEGSAFQVFTDDAEGLFCFGLTDDNTPKDLLVRKKDYASGDCVQSVFDYNDECHVLAGKSSFAVKRVVLYQLE